MSRRRSEEGNMPANSSRLSRILPGSSGQPKHLCTFIQARSLLLNEYAPKTAVGAGD